MNEKKAKKLRKLVRNLMEKKVLETDVWCDYTLKTIKGGMSTTIILDPFCGRSVYQQMKKRA